MPTYDFTFPEAAAGAAVRVRDAAGAIVNEGFVGREVDGGEVTYSVTLGEGSYDASVQPELDLPDAPSSLAAGGGVVLDGAVYEFEYDTGTAEVPLGGLATIVFDTIDPAVTHDGDGSYTLPAGVYVVRYDVEMSAPTADRSATVVVASFGPPALSFDNAPVDLAANQAPVILGQGLVGGGASFHVDVGTTAGDGEVDPAEQTLTYVFVSLTKIA